ncbi:MAG: sigma-70 family RNA polymerase sigma factor [Planctomycetota bacterium]|nr:sigma-70 family RNA polymerase sigma factor [Planctomycetota bacterium]
MSSPVNDLLNRAKGGDADALRELLKKHAGGARASIRNKIAPHWQSVLSEDDVMQVAFIEAFLHIDQLDADTEAGFGRWLGRIAENALHDAVKELSRKKRPPPALQTTGRTGDESYVILLEELVRTNSTPSRIAARGEARKILDSALVMLPPDYRTVIRLYDLEGRSASEVGECMGRSEGAVYMVRTRAHERLRAILGSSSRFFSESP